MTNHDWLAEQVNAAMRADTEEDTFAGARWRINFIFDAMYDDEPTEPDQAIRDLLTDLIHEADARGVDIHDALIAAARMAGTETADWTERDAVASAAKGGTPA